ncbi:MAG: MFS transporter [Pseudomonadota bacterium]
MAVIPRLKFWQMVNMAVGFFGIQFAWSIQMGQMSGLYERLGATPQQVSWFWIAGPITGILIQPIIGNMSDHTWGRLGRRRPYFLIGAILSSIVLLAMPNSPTLWMAASLLWIMDASINISMQPFRALAADIAPEEQRGTAYSFQSFAIGLGSVVSFGLGGILILDWITKLLGRTGVSFVDSIKPICPTSMHALFYIGAAIFIVTILWTVFTVREHPPENMEEFRSKKSTKKAFFASFAETWRIVLDMPANMRRICLVHSFTWFGFFCIFIFFSPMVAANIFNGQPGTPAYERGIAWASLCYLALNTICFISAPILGLLTKRFRNKSVHAVNLVIGSAAFISMYYARTPMQAMAAMAALGIAWASTQAMPYAILADSIPKERYGIFMGAFNIFICIPQIVCSLLAGPVVVLFGGNKAIAMVIGGASMLLAAIFLKRVYEPSVSDLRAGKTIKEPQAA